MNKNITRILVMATGGILLVAILFVTPLLTSRPDAHSLPTPNGYDDFVKAAEMRRGDYSRHKDMPLEELQLSLNEDTETFQRIQLGLSHESRVPIEFSEAAIEPHMKELSGIKSLALMLSAKGWTAELEGHPGEAVQSYMDVVRLGQEVRRGGLIIDILVGVACESIGLNALTGLVSKLDATQCRDLSRKLETIDSMKEPEKTLFEPEHHWARKTYGIRWVILRVVKPGLLKEGPRNALEKVRRTDLLRHRLMMEAAVRSYELEKGVRPAALSDLVPSYLKGIPLDSETGRPMNFPL